MGRALIIKLGAIGDVVMAIPAARLLLERGDSIDWVCGPAALPLLKCYTWINPVLADERAIVRGSVIERLIAVWNLWRRVTSVQYDLCATLYYDHRYRLLALPVRARRKIMLSRSDRALLLVPGRHHTDEYARILTGRIDSETPNSLGLVRPDRLPACPLPEKTAKRRIALVPGGASNSVREQILRRWPLERYVELAALLLVRGWEVVLLGGPDDTWASEAFKTVSVGDWIGKLKLPEVVSACDGCDAVVSHDTGPLHLAGLSTAAMIGLFGPTDPKTRIPRRVGSSALWGGRGFACSPCYDGRDFAPCMNNACMQELTAEAVLRELDTLLCEGEDAGHTQTLVQLDLSCGP